MLSRIETWRLRYPAVYYWLPPVVWMLFIFILSAQPQLPSMPGGWLDTLVKKIGHMVVYAGLTWLLWRAFFWHLLLLAVWKRGFKVRQRRVLALVLAVLLGVLYAISDEFHQTFVPGRQGTVVDVLIDGVGIGMAAASVWKLRRSRAEGVTAQKPL